MSTLNRSASDEEVARARLAFISAGLPSLNAPRRAVSEQATPEQQLVTVEEASARGRATTPGLFERFSLTPRQAVAVLALLACGIVVALTAMGRSSASQVPIDPVSVVPSAVTHASPTLSTSAPPPRVRVHVLGAVSSPGVVTVDAGGIVQDAVLAAGGLRPDADPAELNLAAPVQDGLQVIVGTTIEPRGQVIEQPAASRSGNGAPGLVNLNTATQAELEELPGVGPVLAGAILDWRQQRGVFHSVAELQEVTGIGPKIFEVLQPLVTT